MRKVCLSRLTSGLIVLIAVACFASLSAAQSPASQCPTGMVCISPEAARKALQDSDTVKAQAAQIDVLKQAIDDTKQIVNDLKVELAKATGTLTGAQQSIVDLRSTVQVLSANCKARNRIGLINL